MYLFEKLLEYIFLPSCGICKTIGQGYLCRKCGKDIEKYKIDLIENANIYDNKKIKNVEIQKFYIFKYEEIIRNEIIEYKFNDKPYLYRMFSKIIIEDKKSCEFLKSYDIIIPVPMHYKKERKRGYNQSSLIARQIAKFITELEYCDNSLIKIRRK